MVFNEDDNGDVAPKREIIGANTKLATPLGVFISGNEMFVCDTGPDSILVFNKDDNGDVAPQREITGANTRLQNPFGLFLSGDEIFVLDGGGPSILVFNKDDNGDVAPKREISGANTLLNSGFRLFVAQGEIYTTEIAADRVLVFNIDDNGDVAPKRIIEGANTNINFPFSVALNVNIRGLVAEEENLFMLEARNELFGVELRWENIEDIEYSSFNVWRKRNNEPFKKVTKLAIMSTQGLTDERYSYIDKQAQVGKDSYTYKLEYIKYDGQASFDVPITVYGE